jgi:hypothetical protein
VFVAYKIIETCKGIWKYFFTNTTLWGIVGFLVFAIAFMMGILYVFGFIFTAILPSWWIDILIRGSTFKDESMFKFFPDSDSWPYIAFANLFAIGIAAVVLILGGFAIHALITKIFPENWRKAKETMGLPI